MQVNIILILLRLIVLITYICSINHGIYVVYCTFSKVYDIWREAKQNVFGKMGSSDMMDADVFALFPGNWLTDKVQTTDNGKMKFVVYYRESLHF